MALSDLARQRLQQAFGINRDEIAAADEMVGAIDEGSGLLILQDGAEISGTYDSNILVDGSCTMTGDVLVNGNVFVLSNVNNAGGWELTVRGDLSVEGDIQFDPEDAEVQQGDISVRGDLRFNYINFPVTPVSEPNISVWGDLIGINGGIDGYGYDTSAGLSIYVEGDMMAEWVDLDGGNASETAPAGNGGYVEVAGDCVIYDGLTAEGGHSQWNGMNAGGGGNMYVNGDMIAWADLSGGDAGGEGATADGGNGGYVQVGGDFTLYWLSLEGGDCNSVDGSNRAGYGGGFECWGSVDGDGWFSCSAGNRYGSLSVAGPGHINVTGGDVYAYGDMLIGHGECNGSNDNSSDGEGGSANGGGNGGSIRVWGDLVAYQVQLAGGQGNDEDAGNGGYLRVKGKAHCTYQIDCRGGDSSTLNGSGGQVDVFSGLVANYVNMGDGGGGGAGNEGNVSLSASGYCSINNLSMTDKPSATIRPSGFGSNKATLVLGSITGKTTLTQPNGDATVDISGDVVGTMYMYDLNGGWFAIEGVSIAAGE